jgi:DNA-binding CsgD family transcriptional regulator
MLGEAALTRNKQSATPKPVTGKRLAVRPGAFVFCERASGAIRFQVDATPSGALPVEWAAGLLAMHCVVRGQTPCDFTVLVVPSASLLDPVGQRAQELLAASRATIGHHERLSPREQEVLHCVMRHQSNKEIGARLHVSERTVKFHVSALLAKFNVRDRIDLTRKAAVGLLPAEAAPPHTLFGFPMPLSRENENAVEPQTSSTRGVLPMPSSTRVG